MFSNYKVFEAIVYDLLNKKTTIWSRGTCVLTECTIHFKMNSDNEFVWFRECSMHPCTNTFEKSYDMAVKIIREEEIMLNDILL